MRLALVTLLLVIHTRPQGMADRFRCPRDERLSQELGTLETPVHPGSFAAAFCDWCDAGVFLEVISRAVAFSLFAEGDEEARGKDGPGAWQGIKQGEVRMALGRRRDGFVEVLNGLQSDTELGDEGLHQEGVGGDDTCIGRQWYGALDGLEAGSDACSRAHVVITEEALQDGAARELRGFEGRPAAQEVTRRSRFPPRLKPGVAMTSDYRYRKSLCLGIQTLRYEALAIARDIR
jgi:hypothetical protein